MVRLVCTDKPVIIVKGHVSMAQKSQQLAQLGIPPAERVLLPHIVAVTTYLNSGLGWDCVGREVGLNADLSRLLRNACLILAVCLAVEGLHALVTIVIL